MPTPSNSTRLFAAATAARLGLSLPGNVTELDADLCGVGLLLAHGVLTAAERRAELAALTQRRDAFLREQMATDDGEMPAIGRRGYLIAMGWEGGHHGADA
ncbi:hypothetical protein CCAX7_14770 [Capsulimonas corticalis]|uniref:Uncharacterized protein n=1 Tax=Capsulimonas corticalis TaxID=2219043 RepID=A0A402CZD7_9BACT|nr:hypothetical protein [Capsulimonas corticalis]BDI29426.1 hypothetical protein CCAX7_14770 [Capsulimonas corticalis]